VTRCVHMARHGAKTIRPTRRLMTCHECNTIWFSVCMSDKAGAALRGILTGGGIPLMVHGSRFASSIGLHNVYLSESLASHNVRRPAPAVCLRPDQTSFFSAVFSTSVFSDCLSASPAPTLHGDTDLAQRLEDSTELVQLLPRVLLRLESGSESELGPFVPAGLIDLPCHSPAPGPSRPPSSYRSTAPRPPPSNASSPPRHLGSRWH